MYSVQPCSWAQPRVISLCTAICTHHKPQKGALSPSHHRSGGWVGGTRYCRLPGWRVEMAAGGRRGAAGGLESDGAQVPKQTYDLNGSNRFLVGNLPWKIDTKLCSVEGQRRGELWSSTWFTPRSFNSSISKYSLFFHSTPARPGFALPFCTGSNRFDPTIIDDVKRCVLSFWVEIFWQFDNWLGINKLYTVSTDVYARRTSSIHSSFTWCLKLILQEYSIKWYWKSKNLDNTYPFF